MAGVAAGSATVTVTATDPGGLSATQTFDVTVVVPANRDPVPEGTIDALTVTAGESATAVDDVSENFSDPDGDDAHVHGRLLGQCVRHGERLGRGSHRGRAWRRVVPP